MARRVLGGGGINILEVDTYGEGGREKCVAWMVRPSSPEAILMKADILITKAWLPGSLPSPLSFSFPLLSHSSSPSSYHLSPFFPTPSIIHSLFLPSPFTHASHPPPFTRHPPRPPVALSWVIRLSKLDSSIHMVSQEGKGEDPGEEGDTFGGGKAILGKGKSHEGERER